MWAGILAALAAAACGDDGGSGGSGNTATSSGGSSTTETSSDGSATFLPADCEDAFATLEAPYMVDNVLYDTFVADENGLVLTPMVDPARFEDVLDSMDYPDVDQLVTIDLVPWCMAPEPRVHSQCILRRGVSQ